MNNHLSQIRTKQVKLGDVSSDEISIVFTGDFCPVGRIEKLCLDNAFEKIYGNALPILRDKDLSITNLECPLTKNLTPIKKTGPNLISNPKCVEGIKFGGFDVVSLANNHILDQDEKGLRDTLQICEESGLKTVGAGENLAEAVRPLFVTVKNKKIAILNFAEHEFSIATTNTAGAAPLNPIKNYYQILGQKEMRTLLSLLFMVAVNIIPCPAQGWLRHTVFLLTWV